MNGHHFPNGDCFHHYFKPSSSLCFGSHLPEYIHWPNTCLCVLPPHPPPLFCFPLATGSIPFSWYGCLGLLSAYSWHRDSSLPGSNWVAVFRLLSKWLMPAESLSRLAQNQLLLYYRTSYLCPYRHRVRKSAYPCPLLTSSSSKSVLAPSHLEGTGQISQLV